MTVFLLAIAGAILFGLTNAYAYKRGENSGYITGLEDGLKAQVTQISNSEHKFVVKK